MYIYTCTIPIIYTCPFCILSKIWYKNPTFPIVIKFRLFLDHSYVIDTYMHTLIYMLYSLCII